MMISLSCKALAVISSKHADYKAIEESLLGYVAGLNIEQVKVCSDRSQLGLYSIVQKLGTKSDLVTIKESLKDIDLVIFYWDGRYSKWTYLITDAVSQGKKVEVIFTTPYSVWTELGTADAICITTNGYVTRTGRAVLGRGCALQAKILFPNLPLVLGQLLTQYGNRVFLISTGTKTHLVTIPVKPSNVVVNADKSNVLTNDCKPGDVLPGFLAKADPALIQQSVNALADLIQYYNNWKRVLLPKPGCGNGGLTWPTVLTYLMNSRLADVADRVFICDYNKAVAFSAYMRDFHNQNAEIASRTDRVKEIVV